MYKLTIDKRQYDFILQNIEDEHVLNEMLEANQLKDSYILLLEKDDLENLLDALSNLLIKIGLLPSDEPNETGIFIESIIDKLSLLYYED